ncbi:MAG: glutamate-5-semialdehyde dehydrogenase [Pseudomonadota bacterium]
MQQNEAPYARQMETLGQSAREASKALAQASTEQKNNALMDMAAKLRECTASLLSENAKDMEAAEITGKNRAFLDRLQLTPERVEAMAKGLEDIAKLKDPVGDTLANWERPNGLNISRVRVPLGVIGIIYESRPNVTADAGGLCLKSGNAVILRGGSDSYHSSHAIGACLTKALKAQGLPEQAIQLVPTTDRGAVGMMLQGLNGTLDVIVPRGGKSLVARVQDEARVPVFAHLEGLCHIFIDKAANLEMACEIVLNSKMRRTGICGAVETLLIHRECLETHAAPLIEALNKAGCEIRGDDAIQSYDHKVKPAEENDWTTEYLDAIIAIKTVENVQAAMDHIARYGSQHTDCIISDDITTSQTFLQQVDSAIVLHNASTQFADGGEFGMGAEIGIATGKMHARGPVGVEQLTSFKYIVRGKGQVRA